MAKVKLASAKASWAEAARTNGDALNIDEFLAFTHPESSHSLMAQTGKAKTQIHPSVLHFIESAHCINKKGGRYGEKILLTKM